MVVSWIVKVTADTAFTFCVKNTCCYFALDKVRTDLQQLITKVVQPHVGNFLAPIVGNQLGLLYALPVTYMYGEMMAVALKQMARTVYTIARRIFSRVQPEEMTPFLRDVVMSTTSFAAGFFAKTYFSNYAMPYVGKSLKTIGFTCIPLFGGMYLPLAVLMPVVMVIATPTATVVLGDIVGTITASCSYSLLEHTFRWLFDKRS